MGGVNNMAGRDVIAKLDLMEASLKARIEIFETSINARFDMFEASMNARFDEMSTPIFTAAITPNINGRAGPRD